MTLEELLNIVKNYKEDSKHSHDGHFYTNRKVFLSLSYWYCGLKELESEIEEELKLPFRPYGDAISFLENWRKKMGEYACLAKTGESNWIFSTYYDVATNVLDEVICNVREV